MDTLSKLRGVKFSTELEPPDFFFWWHCSSRQPRSQQFILRAGAMPRKHAPLEHCINIEHTVVVTLQSLIPGYFDFSPIHLFSFFFKHLRCMLGENLLTMRAPVFSHNSILPLFQQYFIFFLTVLNFLPTLVLLLLLFQILVTELKPLFDNRKTSKKCVLQKRWPIAFAYIKEIWDSNMQIFCSSFNYFTHTIQKLNPVRIDSVLRLKSEKKKTSTKYRDHHIPRIIMLKENCLEKKTINQIFRQFLYTSNLSHIFETFFVCKKLQIYIKI